MMQQLKARCELHPDPADCPDQVIDYSPRFDEYGLIIHDGGSSYIVISFCPFCGTRLPDSKRLRWFDELEALGFDEPFDQEIPERYRSDEWYK